MSTKSIGSRYDPPSPVETQRESSSETMSPVYPDRPIKPLPKRRLKDRLSSEAAETITYPPALPATTPMFYSSPSYDSTTQNFPRSQQSGAPEVVDKALIDAQGGGYPAKDVPYEFRGTDLVSDDEGAGRQEGYRSHPIRPQSHSAASSGESADGYESFENTNNKKKRKIPTSAGSGVMHPALSNSLSADLANMGISGNENRTDSQDGASAQYSCAGERVSGNGLSGAGRGRYGRSGRRDTRSPLGTSANASNAWQTGRIPGSRHSSGKYPGKAMSPLPRSVLTSASVSERPSDSGIISQAIAEAAASPLALDKGQENISLLEQQQRAARKNTPAAQFTFNMDSDVSKGPAWPGGQYAASQGHLPQQQLPPQHGKGYSQGTQTSPNIAGQGQGGAAPTQQQQQQQAQQQQHQQQQPPPPKPRRPAAQRYARAARHRKDDQEYENLRNPPTPESMWICEFCEYESIFGRPPEALIRQYEMKDAHERKRQAEKRRLLEKAKSKGRKARKGTKASKANAAAAAAAATANNPTSAPPHGSQHYNQQGYPPAGQVPLDPNDDYYSGDGDGPYDDDDDDDPPISTPHPVPPATPSKIPAPTQHYGAAPRPGDRQGYGAGSGPGGGTQQRIIA